MGTGTFYPEKKTKFFSGLKVPVPRVTPITTNDTCCLVYVYNQWHVNCVSIGVFVLWFHSTDFFFVSANTGETCMNSPCI